MRSDERSSVVHRRHQHLDETTISTYPYVELGNEHGSVDDSSSSSDDSSEDDADFWDVLPDILFFVGSIIYVCLAGWDLIELDKEDSSSSSNDGTDDDATWDTYRVLATGAGLTYGISAVVELSATFQNREWMDPKKFIAEIVLAVTFGIAATCELFAALLADDDHPEPGYAADTASVHIYLINAILSVSDQPLSFSTVHLGLISAGNVLFLLGSIIDATLSYFYIPDMTDAMSHTTAWWSLASAVLWLINSVLYLVSDFLYWHHYRDLESIQTPLLLGLSDQECESPTHEE